MGWIRSCIMLLFFYHSHPPTIYSNLIHACNMKLSGTLTDWFASGAEASSCRAISRYSLSRPVRRASSVIRLILFIGFKKRSASLKGPIRKREQGCIHPLCSTCISLIQSLAMRNRKDARRRPFLYTAYHYRSANRCIAISVNICVPVARAKQTHPGLSCPHTDFWESRKTKMALGYHIIPLIAALASRVVRSRTRCSGRSMRPFPYVSGRLTSFRSNHVAIHLRPPSPAPLPRSYLPL